MLVEDLKNDFYAHVKGKRLLILVNYDIDALCACKILQALFSTDGILYSVVCVDILSDLRTAFLERRTDEKQVLLINCGGTVDLVEFLEPTDDVYIYVLDSHRPLDLCNVYSTGQVRVICPPDDAKLVPEFEDVFRDSDDDSNNEDDEDLEDRLERRREKREWAKKRDDIMFQYQQYSYYSRSSAAIVFDLAWKLSKDSFDLLWYACVAVTEQLLLNKLDEANYLDECHQLQVHISRLQHRLSAAPEDRGFSVNIEYKKQLRLAMYSHWTVEASLLYSVTSATKLKLWTFDGVKRLHQMLAEIGIPLSQCRQRFSSMQLLYRQQLQESIIEAAPRYDLNGIEMPSFSLLNGYRSAVPAMDAVYALIGLLIVDKGKTEKFLDALEALSRSKRARLEEGMCICQKLLQTISRIAQCAMESKQIQVSGPFIFLALQEENPLFCHPYSIMLLAEFALKAYAGRRRDRRMLPLLVSTPVLEEAEDRLCHVAAIAPLATESGKTFFGAAFQKAAETSKTKIIARYFDGSVVQIRLKDRTRFHDALVALL